MDTLKPGLLGRNREAFAARYCNRRLVRSAPRGMGAHAADMKHWDNSGLSHAPELHALLSQVAQFPCEGLPDLLPLMHEAAGSI